jgi:hypothetical protein
MAAAIALNKVFPLRQQILYAAYCWSPRDADALQSDRDS